MRIYKYKGYDRRTEDTLALVKLIFPREMLDYFEVVGFEIYEDSISVRLDERDCILKKIWSHICKEWFSTGESHY